MGKNDAHKRFVKDGPAFEASGILTLIFAIVVIGGIAFYAVKYHGDALSLPSQQEIAKIHSEEKKLR